MSRGRVYNTVITSEEALEINPRNLELWDGFELYMKTTDYAQGTIKNYKCDVASIFFGWLYKNCENKFVGDITPKDMLLFRGFLSEEAKMGNKRILRIRYALMAFGRYLENFENMESFNKAVEAVKAPKNEPIREVSVFTDKDLEVLFAGLFEHEYYLDACVAAMAFYGGARKADIPKIKLEWLNLDHVEGDFFVTPKVITRNGRKAHIYLLKKESDRYIYMWKKQLRTIRKKKVIEDGAEKYLFLSRDMETGNMTPLNVDRLNYIQLRINKVLEEKGIEKTFYWEAARQYYFDYLDRNIEDKALVKKIRKNWSGRI